MSLDCLIYEQDSAKAALHNVVATKIRRSMEESGWVNPDGIGFIYGHPKIVTEDSKIIYMLSHTAIGIQKVWEEAESRDHPSIQDA